MERLKLSNSNNNNQYSSLKDDHFDVRGFHFISFTVVLYVVYFFVRVSPYNITGSIGGVNYNILAYAGSLLVTFIAYPIIENVVRHVLLLGILDHGKTIIYGAFCIFSAYFLFSCYQNEMNLYGGYDLPLMFFRERVNHFLLIIIFTTLFVGIFLMALWYNKTNRNARIIAAVILSIFSAVLAYSPNMFLNRFWGLYHSHAYTNSIINVARLAPYNDVQCSIYGHYGLIYLPFVKLLGDNTNAVAITIAMFTFIMMMSAMYTVSSIIERDSLFFICIIALFGISVTYFSPGEAFAVWPHRYLFPMLTLALLVFFVNKKRDEVLLPWGLIVSTLSIIFNLETGLCCSAVFVAFYLASNWGKNKERNHFSLLLLSILFIAGSFGIAYIIVNTYNILVGGEWNSLLTFIYPICSKEYDINSILTLPIPTWHSGYFLQILVFSYTAYEVIWKVLRRHKDIRNCNEKSNAIVAIDLIVLSVSVSGLGSLTYFMNRTAAGNLSISHLQFVIILAYYAQKGLAQALADREKKEVNSGDWFLKAMYILAFYLLSWFSLESIPGVIPTVSNRMESVWKTDSLNKSVQVFQEEIPVNTLAFGRGMPELYYQMGWNPHIAITDWSDMNSFSIEEVQDKVNASNSFVKTDDVDFSNEAFYLLKHIETDEISYDYYVRYKNDSSSE